MNVYVFVQPRSQDKIFTLKVLFWVKMLKLFLGRKPERCQGTDSINGHEV